MTAPQPVTRFSGLKVRVLSGLVLAPLMMAVIIAGGYWFMGLMVLAALISFYEWQGLSQAGPRPVATMLLGMVYLSICFSSYVGLRFGFESGAWLALAAVLCVWASDTGAYFAGKFIGGPKMAPVLSPKKTWAGLAGAMLSCGLMLEALLYGGPKLQHLLPTDTGLAFESSWICVLIAGAVLGVVGQVGDIFISYFKRRAHLKDTGHLIPGHGGILDRIDALLLVAPVFLLLCLVFVT